MKRIGILGGTSPESTAAYYRRITREYTRRFGDHGYPEIVIYSVSFQQFIDWMGAGDWHAVAAELASGLRTLGDAGAELGLIAAVTLHRVFGQAVASSPFPLISILDVVSDRLAKLRCRRAVLLGTKITMSSSFFSDRLAAFGIETIVPTGAEQDAIDRILFGELDRGIIEPISRETVIGIAERLIACGADAVILGCTELPLLLGPGDLPVPVLDTTALHADAALDAALG